MLLALLACLHAVPSTQVEAHGVGGAAQGVGEGRPAGAVRLLLDAINRDRRRHGLHPLVLDPRASSCSIRHSWYMLHRNSLTHAGPDSGGCSAAGPTGQNVGVVWGATPRRAVLMVERLDIDEGPCPDPGCPGAEWEAHGHYLNLLNRSFHRVGVGIAIHGSATWVTEDFRR